MVTRRLAQADRRTHDEALADGLRPGCTAIAILFTVFGVWHLADLEASAAAVMAPLAFATASLAAGAAVALARHRILPGRAHLLAAGLAAAMLLNCHVQLGLTGSDHLTVNVLLLIVGVGVCLVDPLWVGALTGGFAASWVVALALHGPAGEVPQAIAHLLTAVAVAVVANTLRRRTLARLLQAQAGLRALSQRCDLTGLLNRRGFLDAAERRIAAGRPVTLWFLDVDGLKQVNDRHGHDVGDVLLRSVATALGEVFPDADVARLSGDEFAVVEPDRFPNQEAERRRTLDVRLAQAAASTGLPVQVSTGTRGPGPAPGSATSCPPPTPPCTAQRPRRPPRAPTSGCGTSTCWTSAARPGSTWPRPDRALKPAGLPAEDVGDGSERDAPSALRFVPGRPVGLVTFLANGRAHHAPLPARAPPCPPTYPAHRARGATPAHHRFPRRRPVALGSGGTRSAGRDRAVQRHRPRPRRCDDGDGLFRRGGQHHRR